MPNMDGISMVKAVKQMAAYKFTPIVMLTTESQESKKKEGQEAGAKAWIVKPFKPDQLLGVVQKLLRERAHDRKNGMSTARSPCASKAS